MTLGYTEECQYLEKADLRPDISEYTQKTQQNTEVTWEPNDSGQYTSKLLLHRQILLNVL